MSRVLIVGAGSIGSRRARLLAEMGHEVGIADTFSDHRISVTQNLLERGYSVWPETTGPTSYYDAALICTPAKDHVRMARECVEGGITGLFIEKPLSVSMDGIPELIAECEARGVVTMGACNMRWAYPRVAGRFVEFVSHAPLSSWRDGAKAAYRGNGVVLESALHELDVASSWLGPIVEVEAGGDDDHATLMVRMAEGGAVISVDWRDGIRAGRIVTAPGPNDGYWHKVAPDTSDEMYRHEMQHFLGCVEAGVQTTNPIANAAVTLGWALKARDMTRTVAA